MIAHSFSETLYLKCRSVDTQLPFAMSEIPAWYDHYIGCFYGKCYNDWKMGPKHSTAVGLMILIGWYMHLLHDCRNTLSCTK